jgi:hypothetical protein
MAEEFDDKDDVIPPKPPKVGYNQLVDSVFDPKDYLRRCEMSIMPLGNKAYKMAKVIARQRVRAAIIKGEDYDVVELLLDSYAIVKRAEKGWLGEKAVELKALENDRDSQIINQMSGE